MRPFEDIVAEHGPAVMRVCRALLGPDDADDAWSETFVSAMRAFPRMKHDHNVRGWLVTIAHNRAIDQLRSRRKHPSPTAELADVASHDPPDAVDDDALRAALGTLPPKQRRAVIYRYLADLSYADIASLLECSQAAARRNAADGIAKLRRHYGKEAAS